jgi:hypothetical protein
MDEGVKSNTWSNGRDTQIQITNGSIGMICMLTKLLKSLGNVTPHLSPIKPPLEQRYPNHPHSFNYYTLSCPPMPPLSSPPYQTLSQRDAPPLPVELRNWSGTCLLQLDLSRYPPRVISVLDTEPRMPPKAPGLSLPLGELPVLPLVTNPLCHPQSLQNDQALQSHSPSSLPTLCVEPSTLHTPGKLCTDPLRQLSPIEPEIPLLSLPDPLLRLPTPPARARSLSPIPNPPSSHRLLRGSTVWEHYLRTQGGQVRNPLYPSTTPTQRKTRKPRRYTARPEEMRDEEILVLSQIPTGGRMLTHSYLGKIKQTPLPPYPVSD